MGTSCGDIDFLKKKNIRVDREFIIVKSVDLEGSTSLRFSNFFVVPVKAVIEGTNVDEIVEAKGIRNYSLLRRTILKFFEDKVSFRFFSIQKF